MAVFGGLAIFAWVSGDGAHITKVSDVTNSDVKNDIMLNVLNPKGFDDS